MKKLWWEKWKERRRVIMGELKPTLDEWAKQHDELCTYVLMCTDDLSHCDCGRAERVAELAQLRAALDKARKVIDRMWTHSRLDGQCEPRDLLNAAAWLEKYPKETP